MTSEDPSVQDWSRILQERDNLAVHLVADHTALGEAVRLLEFALHLRMHGENAPGGTETWAQFDREVEYFLRSGTRWPDPAAGASRQTSYPPVQVPENTGRHPGESGEILTIKDIGKEF